MNIANRLPAAFPGTGFTRSGFAPSQFAPSGFSASTLQAPGLSMPLLQDNDLAEQIRLAERADWLLLRLVGCTALATLLLSAAISLGH